MADDTVKKRATFAQKLSLLGYRVLCFILRHSHVKVVALFGRCLGFIVWALMPSRRRIVARNFRIVVDPALRPAKLAPMVRRNIVRTTMNLACSLKTGLMTDKEVNASISVEIGEDLEKQATNGRTVIACIPHAGNWEILARIRPMFPKIEHYGSMYRRLSNPLLEDFVYRSRTSHGCAMYSKEDGLKEVLKLTSAGGVVGVLSDQFTQEGLFLPYFGKVTGVTPLPALLFKRCKGMGCLHAVCSSNTGIGQWNISFGRTIDFSTEGNSIASITMQVNKALEQVQNVNIIDGFWMHHRWKSTRVFAPKQKEEVHEQIRRYATIPYRIIVVMPEAFEEAAILIPFLRTLKNCRADMQLTVACPTEQAAFWEGMPEVAYVVRIDAPQSVAQQLDEDRIYNDGPFDYVYMLSENRKVLKQLHTLAPVRFAGFDENPLRKSYRFHDHFTCTHTSPPQPRINDYAQLLSTLNDLELDVNDYLISANKEAHGVFIAPFSSLGAADAWPEERWAELVSRLPQPPVLLALECDTEKAQAMAERLGIPCRCTPPQSVKDILGPDTELYAVDGLLPQLAALCGCRCTVLMASRLKECYAPLGGCHRILFNHVPCHPCYRHDCDMPEPCTHNITVDDMLA